MLIIVTLGTQTLRHKCEGTILQSCQKTSDQGYLKTRNRSGLCKKNKGCLWQYNVKPVIESTTQAANDKVSGKLKLNKN